MSTDIEQLMRWASLVLTLPVMAYSAAPFFSGAWRDLRLMRLGMDVPVAIGIAVAFGASVWATINAAGAVYFDSVSMFVFLLLSGRYLELLARQRAGSTLQYLARLAPETANRCKADALGETETVASALLLPGDLLLVRPGETLPSRARGRNYGALQDLLQPDCPLATPPAVASPPVSPGAGPRAALCTACWH